MIRPALAPTRCAPVLLTAALLAAAGPALAFDPAVPAAALACPNDMSLDAIVEPWEENTASYDEGRIRLALIDLIEPAAAAFQLVILHPPRDEVGGRQCHLIAPHEYVGFPDIAFDRREADEDPESGLIISLPIRITPGESPEDGWTLMAITINHQTGEIRYQGAEE